MYLITRHSVFIRYVQNLELKKINLTPPLQKVLFLLKVKTYEISKGLRKS